MRLDRITELARKYVEYDMISTHTELPDFPVPRVRLLYTFLTDREDATQKSAENCALAAYLVQTGMDTHDLIDLGSGEQQECKMRSRQLKVLAGDYFSSVFYALLAGAGEIDMVSAMSSAICEANSLKVKLYTKLKQMLLTAEDYLKESTQVKMSLFLAFSGLLDKSKQNVWRLMLTELSRCEVVMDELKHSSSIPEKRRGYAYLHILETGASEDKEMLRRHNVGEREWGSMLIKYNMKEQLSGLLQQSVERVQMLLQECRGDKLRTEIVSVLEPFQNVLSIQRRAAQEG